jgi:hypothetical protein
MQAREPVNHKLFYLLLLRAGKYTFLPDLYDTVGAELMYDLCNMFAGTEIKFPTLNELRKHAVDVDIYTRLAAVKENRDRFASVARELADHYCLDVDAVKDYYASVRKFVKDTLG